MDADFTQQQSPDDQQRARELSMHRTRPPTEVPGYELTQFLGAGAYGEVWIGLDRTTGRKVAVKFYRHRGSVDWTQLSREVEKLVFLSADRYVVQLLDVGWDAEPPYYVMEYVEQGSLEQLLEREGPRSVEEAVELFRETAIGLNHAHARGVLHCDLKPANILLDEDGRPRLADFGQSRLSHEQAPSLGTLFYMSPEQADLQAVPDARWDVYALGAILYAMLVGRPPHQEREILARIEAAEGLGERLRCYRQSITSRGPVDEHRHVPGMDRALVEILDRCLAVRPAARYANVQAVLSALHARDQARLRRPLLLLGIVGPLLLMLVVAIFGWRGYRRALQDSNRAVTDMVVENNALSAQYVAATVTTEIDRYFRAVERVATDADLLGQIVATTTQLQPELQRLADPELPEAQFEQLRLDFVERPARLALQQRMDALLEDPQLPKAASWFYCDANGTHVAGAFNRQTTVTVGRNFAYRTYCHGGPKDLDPASRPLPETHVRQTHLSAPLHSEATGTIKLAVSTPIHHPAAPERFMGVIVVTVEVGDFLTFAATSTQFAVLVDGRDNGFRGMILNHPLFNQVFLEEGRLPERYMDYRVPLEQDLSGGTFRDPLAVHPRGGQYDRLWIAARAEVAMPMGREHVNGKPPPSGLFVLIQEDQQAALQPVTHLGARLVREAVFALGGILVVVFLLWYFVFRVVGEPRIWTPSTAGTSLTNSGSTTPQAHPTIPLPKSPIAGQNARSNGNPAERQP